MLIKHASKMMCIVAFCQVFMMMALSGCEKRTHCAGCTCFQTTPVSVPKFEAGLVVRSKLGKGTALITAIVRSQKHLTQHRYGVTILDKNGEAKLIRRNGHDWEFTRDTQIWLESEIELIDNN